MSRLSIEGFRKKEDQYNIIINHETLHNFTLSYKIRQKNIVRQFIIK